MRKPSKGNNQSQQVSIQKSQISVGPIPNPETLAGYEQIQSGFADRVITMAEIEQRERVALNNRIIETERELQKIEFQNFRRGQWFAVISVLSIVILCAYGFYLGYANQASTISVSVIVAIALAFLTGKAITKQSKNKQN